MAPAGQVLRNGRVLRTGSAVPEALDIVVGTDGRIAELIPGAPIEAGTDQVDLAGKLVVPGLVDMHQHLDKSRTVRQVPNPEGTLIGAISAFSRYAANVSGADLAARAERTIEACLQRGTVAIRTHANVDADLELRGIEALMELRERLRDRITLQIVAFLSGAAGAAAAASARLEGALELGADVVGGAPALADDPGAFVELLFDASDRHGLPLDLHLDEHLDPGRQLFDAVTERTRALGLQGRVVASHGSVLSALPPAQASRIIDGLAEAGIGVVTLPAANLFLQGRHADRLPPRGLTRVAELMAAGVPVACASDNIQDPFVPVGTGDMLEIARWTLLAGHLGAAEIGPAFEMATAAPARLMGLGRDYGVHPGARADLLITAAEDPADLVASGPLARTVLVGGRIVAGTL